jgi:hypothetical protein
MHRFVCSNCQRSWPAPSLVGSALQQNDIDDPRFSISTQIQQLDNWTKWKVGMSSWPAFFFFAPVSHRGVSFDPPCPSIGQSRGRCGKR